MNIGCCGAVVLDSYQTLLCWPLIKLFDKVIRVICVTIQNSTLILKMECVGKVVLSVALTHLSCPLFKCFRILAVVILTQGEKRDKDKDQRERDERSGGIVQGGWK